MSENMKDSMNVLVTVIAVLLFLATIYGYFSKKRVRRRESKKRMESNIADLRINHRKSFVEIGAVTSQQELSLTVALAIASDMKHMEALQDRWHGTYEVMVEIRDDAKALGMKV